MAKKDFIVQVTSPLTGNVFVAKKGGRKYMSKSEAGSVMKKILPKFPAKTYKTKVRKVGFVDKILHLK